ncbi:MAG: hypothetical protein A4E67_01522 [Syntrophaceae bacterium PtaB.Bin038]|jgi:hypothetical protein|nr:MAG: hypothetical protein A4E67_01522 [Syntrophaceae bacterium PtaB.Bin038]
MSYYNAAGQAGTCKGFDREENDYLYDAPQRSAGILQPLLGTSHYAIERKAQATGGDHAWQEHEAPDAWEDLLLPVAA